MIVKLTGPTGIEENKNALTKPASAAIKMDDESAMELIRAVRLVVFLFDFTPPRARETWTHKAINQIRGEKRGQNVVKNFLLKDEQRPKEDGSANGGTGQGLAYQFNDGSATPFTTTYTIEPQQEPIVLGTPVPQGAGYSPVVGTPPDKSGGYTLAATLLINLRSASANTTIVRVTEFD